VAVICFGCAAASRSETPSKSPSPGMLPLQVSVALVQFRRIWQGGRGYAFHFLYFPHLFGNLHFYIFCIFCNSVSSALPQTAFGSAKFRGCIALPLFRFPFHETKPRKKFWKCVHFFDSTPYDCRSWGKCQSYPFVVLIVCLTFFCCILQKKSVSGRFF
jgi:hypothetical protein